MSAALAGASPSLHVAWVLRPFDLFPAGGGVGRRFLPLSLLGSSAGAVFRRRTPFAFLSWLFLTWWMIAAVAIRMVAVTERLYYERCARRGLSFAACRLGVAALRLVPCWGWGWPSGLIIISHRRP